MSTCYCVVVAFVCVLSCITDELNERYARKCSILTVLMRTNFNLFGLYVLRVIRLAVVPHLSDVALQVLTVDT